MRRFVYLGVALGLTLGAGAIVSLPACYDLPKPACGFRCGPANECPTDYTCSSLEPRCHLDGSDPAMLCDGTDDGADAMPDMPIDMADAPIDMEPDMMPDMMIDAPIDAVDAPIDTVDAPIDAPIDTVDAPID